MIRYIRVPIVLHDDDENVCQDSCLSFIETSYWCLLYKISLEPHVELTDERTTINYYHRCKECKENEVE